MRVYDRGGVGGVGGFERGLLREGFVSERDFAMAGRVCDRIYNNPRRDYGFGMPFDYARPQPGSWMPVPQPGWGLPPPVAVATPPFAYSPPMWNRNCDAAEYLYRELGTCRREPMFYEGDERSGRERHHSSTAKKVEAIAGGAAIGVGIWALLRGLG